MTKEVKQRLVRWLAIAAIIFVVRFAAGGRVWDYMVDHLLLTALLPLVVLFLVLFVRGMMIQRGRHQEEARRIDGAESAKP